MNLQNLLTALEVRQFHRHTAVKTAGTQQRRVQSFGTVGGSQNDNAGVALKAVHFGEQLVEGLFPLIVAAELSVTLFADGVDLIDKDDAGSLFLGLIEQITDLGSAHADEHLHKFRTGHGEEGHIGFTGYGLGKHGLTGSGRAYQQDALGHARRRSPYT